MTRIVFRVIGFARLISFTEITGFPNDPEVDEEGLRKAAEIAMGVDPRITGYELVEDANADEDEGVVAPMAGV